MPDFKYGDRVVCVRNNHRTNLQLGKDYTITRTEIMLGKLFVYVAGDNEGYICSRFKLASSGTAEGCIPFPSKRRKANA